MSYGSGCTFSGLKSLALPTVVLLGCRSRYQLGPRGDGVVEPAALHQVVFTQYVLADQATRFAHADPRIGFEKIRLFEAGDVAAFQAKASRTHRHDPPSRRLGDFRYELGRGRMAVNLRRGSVNSFRLAANTSRRCSGR